MKEAEKFRTNTLYYYANQYAKKMTKEEDIESIDMTEPFLAELDEMIKNGEIIIININAKMRLGKSTLAFAIAVKIWNLLKKYGYRKKSEKFGLNNLARDHQEHSKLMRDPNTRFTVVVTDESNELENTGENVSAERALSKVFSDVQASRYVHRVCCSPKETIDPNADIMLSIISTDKKRKITHSKLYYRYYEGGNEITQLLGYVNINVAEIIKRWEEIAPKFYKVEKTKEDEEEIAKAAKEDWYTDYIIKKHEKMELITREGIFKPRILEYAKVIMKIVNDLKPLAREQGLITKDIIRNYVKIEYRKEKIPQSMIGEELATREIDGMLQLYKSHFKLSRKIKELDEKKIEGKIKLGKHKEQCRQLEEMRDKILQAISYQEEELKHYQEIDEKYNRKN